VTAEVNVPDEAVNTGWHEFRYPRPAVDEPSEAFLRGLRAAAPLIECDALERQIAGLIQVQQRMRADDDPGVRRYAAYGVEEAISQLRGRVAELRGDR
jgi:hypothetical protein